MIFLDTYIRPYVVVVQWLCACVLLSLKTSGCEKISRGVCVEMDHTYEIICFLFVTKYVIFVMLMYAIGKSIHVGERPSPNKEVIPVNLSSLSVVLVHGRSVITLLL